MMHEFYLENKHIAVKLRTKFLCTVWIQTEYKVPYFIFTSADVYVSISKYKQAKELWKKQFGCGPAASAVTLQPSVRVQLSMKSYNHLILCMCYTKAHRFNSLPRLDQYETMGD